MSSAESEPVRSQTHCWFGAYQECHWYQVSTRSPFPFEMNASGFKLTLGIVSCCSVRIDCPGPMGKSAWDVAALLEQIASPPRPFTKFALAPYNDLSTSPIPYRLGVPSP